MRGLPEAGLQGKEQGMKVKIIYPTGETEFDIPDSKEELVRALLWELATGASSGPLRERSITK
jgi:hypothetical protein